jgi:hypothetical protein
MIEFVDTPALSFSLFLLRCFTYFPLHVSLYTSKFPLIFYLAINSNFLKCAHVVVRFLAGVRGNSNKKLGLCILYNLYIYIYIYIYIPIYITYIYIYTHMIFKATLRYCCATYSLICDTILSILCRSLSVRMYF